MYGLLLSNDSLYQEQIILQFLIEIYRTQLYASIKILAPFPQCFLLSFYALVGGAPEAYGSRRVCLRVCVSVCLSRAFICNG